MAGIGQAATAEVEALTQRSAAQPGGLNGAGEELKRGAFVSTMALLAANFRGIFTFLVARMLGPAALGTFSVAWATLELVSKVSVFGLDNTITTFIARSQAKGDQVRSRMLFHVAIAMGMTQSILVGGLAALLVRALGNYWGLPQEISAAFVFILAALPGITLFRVANSVSWGMKVMKHEVSSRGFVESFATTAAFLVAFFIGWRRFAPEIAAICGSTACGLTALYLAARLFRAFPLVRDRSLHLEQVRELLAYGAPVSAHQLLTALLYRLDVLMLGMFVGRAPGVTLGTVGVYGAVLEVAGGLRKVNQAFNPIFTPIIAGMTATGQDRRAAATYAQLSQWMLWILLPLICFMLLAGKAILMLYGPGFRSGASWLTIVAIGCAMNSYVSFGETIIMVQKPKLNLIHSCITCVVAIVANWLLIPRFGALGAAFGLLTPYLVQGILRFVALRYVFHWRNPWTNLAPPFIASAIALAPALVCRELLNGLANQIVPAVLFLAIIGVEWKIFSRRHRDDSLGAVA